MMMNEIWKVIKEYPNYMISNYGNIKSLNYKRTGKEQILKQSINGRGYCYVNVSIKNKYKNISIHREVAKAFIPTDNVKMDINHKDGNKTNNYVDNLEWCTRSYNIQHAYNNGFKKGGKGMAYKKRCKLAIDLITSEETINMFTSIESREQWLKINHKLIDILKGVDKE